MFGSLIKLCWIWYIFPLAPSDLVYYFSNWHPESRVLESQVPPFGALFYLGLLSFINNLRGLVNIPSICHWDLLIWIHSHLLNNLLISWFFSKTIFLYGLKDTIFCLSKVEKCPLTISRNVLGFLTGTERSVQVWLSQLMTEQQPLHLKHLQEQR